MDMSKRKQVANMLICIPNSPPPPKIYAYQQLMNYLVSVYPNKYARISQVQHIIVNQNKHSTMTCMSSKEWKFIDLRR